MRPSKKYSTYPAGSKDVLGALKHLIYPNQCDSKRLVLNLTGFYLSDCLSAASKIRRFDHRQIGLLPGDVVQKSKDLSQW